MTTALREVDGTQYPAAGVWEIDPAHTEIAFNARHLMVTKVRGVFESFTSTITVGDHPADTEIEAKIDASSITTHAADRDNHLRSADFFDTDSYPELTFVSTAVEARGSDWKVTGDLTIRDQTRPVTLDVEFLGTIVDPFGNTKAGFSATTSIDREDWGLTWNAALESGGVMVSKQINIEIEGQAVLNN